MIFATNYKVELIPGTDYFCIKNKDAPICPACGSLLSGYDHRIRKIISDEGVSISYKLRRLRCNTCNCLHLEAPDFMAPKKHYNAETIASALNGRIDFCPAEESTIRRWRKK